MNSRILEMGVVSRLWLVPGLGGGGLKMAFEHLSIAGFLEAVTSTEISEKRVGWSSFRRARTCGDGRRAGSARVRLQDRVSRGRPGAGGGGVRGAFWDGDIRKYRFLILMKNK